MKKAKKFTKAKPTKKVIQAPPASPATPSKKTNRLSRFLLPEFLIIPFLIINLVLLFACFTLFVSLNTQETIGIQPLKIDELILPAFSQQTPVEVGSRAYIVYDPTSRMVMNGKNEYLQFAPASSTKMMTALVALDFYQLNDVIVARNVGVVKGSKMNLIEGEAMTVGDLLYGLMLPSGNDAAYVLAQNYPGGQTAFVQKMNEKAQELGLKNTEFTDPSGLRDDNYTTAFDLARLGNAVLQNPDLAKVVKTQAITVYNTAQTSVYPLENLNELLLDPNVDGVKTGFTDEAGGVLVTAYNSDGRRYIIVVLKSEDRFYDTQQIMYGIIPQIELVSYRAGSYR